MAITINGSGIITNDITFSGNVTANGSMTSNGIYTLALVPNYRNCPNIASNYTISNTYNELSIGPININDGVTVTVNDNANWVIV